MSGIKENYPRISSRINKKLATYIQLTRPLTLTSPIIGGIGGGLMGYKSVYGNTPALFDGVVLFPIIFATVTLLLIQAGNNMLNQAAESKLDAAAKPYRPIPSGMATVEEVFGLVMVLYGFALFRSATVNETFSGLVLILMVLTVIYSVEPFYLKKRLWLNSLNLGIARGAVGFLCAFSVYGDPFTTIPLSIALVLTVYVFGANSTKDYADMKSDASFKIRTVYTVYGVKKANMFVSAFFLIPYPLILLLIQVSYLPSQYVWMLLLVPLSIYSVYSIMKDRTLSLVENSLSWLSFYVMLGAFFVGFAFIFITIN